MTNEGVAGFEIWAYFYLFYIIFSLTLYLVINVKFGCLTGTDIQS